MAVDTISETIRNFTNVSLATKITGLSSICATPATKANHTKVTSVVKDMAGINKEPTDCLKQLNLFWIQITIKNQIIYPVIHTFLVSVVFIA